MAELEARFLGFVTRKAAQNACIDSSASGAILSVMGSTLTIRDLDEVVKQKLRLRAAMHQRSMEAEARDILARAVSEEPSAQGAPVETPEDRMRRALDAVRGIWKGRMSTDESMELTRGDAIDDAYTRR